MNTSFINTVRIAGAVAALALAMPASAIQYSFGCITNNNGNAGYCSSVASQMRLDVTSGGGQSVVFKVTNNVGLASSITGIYWDTPVSLVVQGNGNASAFSLAQTGASGFSLDLVPPPNLPSQNTASPAFTTDFSYRTSGTGNGINAAGDSVSVTATLVTGKTFSDLLASLASGATRLGIHVQSIAGTSCRDEDGNVGFCSESMVNTSTAVVPVPAALPLMLSGLLGFGFLSRRRTRH